MIASLFRRGEYEWDVVSCEFVGGGGDGMDIEFLQRCRIPVQG